MTHEVHTEYELVFEDEDHPEGLRVHRNITLTHILELLGVNVFTRFNWPCSSTEHGNEPSTSYLNLIS